MYFTINWIDNPKKGITLKEIKITKQEVINKVEDLEEDNVALWHFMQSNEKEIERLEKKVVELKNEWDKLKEKI